MLQAKDRTRKPQRRQIYQRLYKDRLAPLISEEMEKTRPNLGDEETEGPASLKARRMAAMQQVVNEQWPKEVEEVVNAVEAEYNKQVEELSVGDDDEEMGDGDEASKRLARGERTPQQYYE
jgi:hypothetical protein